MKACLRWGYFCAAFSLMAMIVAYFLYGRNVALPDQPGVALIYRAGFLFADPLVGALGIDSLFWHIMLAGFFQIAVSFGIGLSAAVVLRLARRMA